MDKKTEKYLAQTTVTAVEAMKKIDENSRGVLFIVDKEGRLTGCVTDGDIRRWLIKTGDLSANIMDFMNSSPLYLYEKDRKKAVPFMKENFIRALPLLTPEERVAEVMFLSEPVDNRRIRRNRLEHIPAVIMAGGKGTRLYPYTKILPKPLIPIGEIPILERIINRFFEYGITDYYLTVNYKKEMIKSYFSELQHPYILNYIEEKIPLGTAGSIRLIREKFSTPVIITNCDTLISSDYSDIFEYHKTSKNGMTIVSALKNIAIPYGVLSSGEGGVITGMEEKPNLSYFVNTGMYVLNPELINLIPENTCFHMTDLAELLIKKGVQVGMYPVSEDSFLDMGEFDEMHRMEEKLGCL